MVIFDSYVKLPEGIVHFHGTSIYKWMTKGTPIVGNLHILDIPQKLESTLHKWVLISKRFNSFGDWHVMGAEALVSRSSWWKFVKSTAGQIRR